MEAGIGVGMALLVLVVVAATPPIVSALIVWAMWSRFVRTMQRIAREAAIAGAEHAHKLATKAAVALPAAREEVRQVPPTPLPAQAPQTPSDEPPRMMTDWRPAPGRRR